MSVLSLAVLALVVPQTSVELKLKLREDETVRFRSVLNVATYSEQKIDERVASMLVAFTFAGEEDGKIPVKGVVEDFEDMDPNNDNGGGAALRLLDLSFSMDKKGRAEPVQYSSSNPALEPFAVLFGKTLEGFNSTGFLGLTMPEATVSEGGKWSLKVGAADFMAPALAPAGNAFQLEGQLDATFELLDLINVNNKRHARIEANVAGSAPIDIDTPEFAVSGDLQVTSTTSLVLDLETGLITRSKTDTVADLMIDGNSAAQIVISNLVYRV